MTSKYSGYMGKFLDIDLSNKKIGDYDINDKEREQYLGGKCLAAKILWDNLSPGIDPLSEKNIFVVTTGPLTGSGAPQTSRFNCSTKSPLCDGIISSNSGGDFGFRLKKAGYDGLILRGKAEGPTWVEITEENVLLKDASHLWGLDTEKAQEGLDKQTGALVIGPAGENQVLYACVISGERASGRGGVGAVLGSKNIKLITAKGSKSIPCHNKEKFKKQIRSWTKMLNKHSVTGGKLPKYGTANLMNPCNETNTLGTRNFQHGNFKDAKDVSGEELAEKHLTKNWGCTSCPIRCSRAVKYKEKEIKGPEFETMGMFGPMIENNKIEHIIEWNYLCDLYGLDTISTGSTIACAMELSELGHLPKFPCAFGKPDGISELLKDIAYKKGHGKMLAEGSKRLAANLGRPEVAMQTKGLEYAIYEPRSSVGHGLGYATSNRGGCHLNGGYLIFLEALGAVTMDPYTPHAKAGLTAVQQNLMEAVSASGNCIFSTYAIVPDIPKFLYNRKGFTGWIVSEVMKLLRFPLRFLGLLRPWMVPIHVPLIPHSKVVSSFTGMNMHLGNLLAVGERGFTLERMFNMREGLSKTDDSLPPRLTEEPQQSDNPKSKVPLAKMLPAYYKVRGWDGDGRPSRRLLKKLKMDFCF